MGTAEITEAATRIEPCFIEAVAPETMDVVAMIASSSTELGNRIHPKTATSLRFLVRIMNSYYSNLIEGHKTRPRDIESALKGEAQLPMESSSGNAKRRDLLTEAINHIRVQELIDTDTALVNGQKQATSQDFIKNLHCEFYRNAPPDLLRIESSDTSFMMAPGEYRTEALQHEVAVGSRRRTIASPLSWSTSRSDTNLPTRARACVSWRWRLPIIA
jgi:Fic family protein